LVEDRALEEFVASALRDENKVGIERLPRLIPSVRLGAFVLPLLKSPLQRRDLLLGRFKPALEFRRLGGRPSQGILALLHRSS